MKIPFVGGAYEARSKNANAQRCLNLYPVVNQQGGKEPLSMQHTPGLDPSDGYNLNSLYRFVVTDAGGSPFSPTGSDDYLVVG
jgi:hypothetical protein